MVVVAMGVGGSSGIGEGKGSGGNEANSSDSDGRGPYNNQLKDPMEEMTAAGTVTATDTATAMVKATEKMCSSSSLGYWRRDRCPAAAERTLLSSRMEFKS